MYEFVLNKDFVLFLQSSDNDSLIESQRWQKDSVRNNKTEETAEIRGELDKFGCRHRVRTE
jgi:hypothetical protein